MAAANQIQAEENPLVEDGTNRFGMMIRAKDWIASEASSWMLSLLIHTVLIMIAALFLGSTTVEKIVVEAPEFESLEQDEMPEPDLTHFEVGETSIDPSELSTDTLTMHNSAAVDIEGTAFGAPGSADGDTTDLVQGGGTPATSGMASVGGGFSIRSAGLGPVGKGGGGLEGGAGFGKNVGKGGAGIGFGSRDGKMRGVMLGSGGGTKSSERAVAAALSWIARHQRPDGSWSLDHSGMCKDPSCTGPGQAKSDSAATALALLPFLAAGQTHQTKGPYQKSIAAGISWLISHQKPNGDLSAGGSQMYSHGLAAIALCEAYGISQDKRVGVPAQGAIRFIESGQDPQTGGWWYSHGQKGGDTSVFGWQLMALKSAQMSGLSVNPGVFEASKKWLASVAKGTKHGTFSYVPDSGASQTMTSVGLLTSQYLGIRRVDPPMEEGVAFLMSHLPNANRDFYYWYYATQVMHNIPGPEWDIWNRQMRRTLIESQIKEGCAAGSWDPILPSKVPHAEQGGRLMVTAMGALTLEVYYRYLPLYKLNPEEELAKVAN